MKTLRDLQSTDLLKQIIVERDARHDKVTHIELDATGGASLGFWAEASLDSWGDIDESFFSCGHFSDPKYRECTEQERKDLLWVIGNLFDWFNA